MSSVVTISNRNNLPKRGNLLTANLQRGVIIFCGVNISWRRSGIGAKRAYRGNLKRGVLWLGGSQRYHAILTL